jgi:hypothetical protein
MTTLGTILLILTIACIAESVIIADMYGRLTVLEKITYKGTKSEGKAK